MNVIAAASSAAAPRGECLNDRVGLGDRCRGDRRCETQQPAFGSLTEPTTRGTRRLAGIDLSEARNRHVVGAVLKLSTKPDGFTVAQLAEAVRPSSGQDANTYSARNAAYDMAKMVGKKLLRRIERSRRYAVDPPAILHPLRLPPPPREGHQAAVGRRRPPPRPAAETLYRPGPTLRRTARRTPSNLSNYRPRHHQLSNPCP